MSFPYTAQELLLNTDDEYDKALVVIAGNSLDPIDAILNLTMLGFIEYVGKDTHRPGDLTGLNKPRVRYANGALHRYAIEKEARDGSIA